MSWILPVVPILIILAYSLLLYMLDRGFAKLFKKSHQASTQAGYTPAASGASPKH